MMNDGSISEIDRSNLLWCYSVRILSTAGVETQRGAEHREKESKQNHVLQKRDRLTECKPATAIEGFLIGRGQVQIGEVGFSGDCLDFLHQHLAQTLASELLMNDHRVDNAGFTVQMVGRRLNVCMTHN